MVTHTYICDLCGASFSDEQKINSYALPIMLQKQLKIQLITQTKDLCEKCQFEIAKNFPIIYNE